MSLNYFSSCGAYIITFLFDFFNFLSSRSDVSNYKIEMKANFFAAINCKIVFRKYPKQVLTSSPHIPIYTSQFYLF